MIQHSKIFPKQRHQNHLVKSQQPGFLTIEALIAAIVSALVLAGTIKIISILKL